MRRVLVIAVAAVLLHTLGASPPAQATAVGPMQLAFAASAALPEVPCAGVCHATASGSVEELTLTIEGTETVNAFLIGADIQLDFDYSTDGLACSAGAMEGTMSITGGLAVGEMSIGTEVGLVSSVTFDPVSFTLARSGALSVINVPGGEFNVAGDIGVFVGHYTLIGVGVHVPLPTSSNVSGCLFGSDGGPMSVTIAGELAGPVAS